MVSPFPMVLYFILFHIFFSDYIYNKNVLQFSIISVGDISISDCQINIVLNGYYIFLHSLGKNKKD